MPSRTDETPIENRPDAAPAGRWIEGLSPDLPLIDALDLVFRQRWQGVLHYLSSATEGDSPEAESIHKLRVGSRRLSAVLEVLAHEFPGTVRQRVLRRVAKLRRRCGKARDLDVRRQFLESLLPHCSVEDAAAIELLCERAVARRKRAEKDVARRVPKLGKKLTRSADKLRRRLERIEVEGESLPGSFGPAAGRVLLQELAELWRLAEKGFDAPSAWHPLRVACKRLRYTTEVFMPTLPESFATDYYRQIEHLQDLLGEVHDATKATRAVRRLRTKWRRRGKSGKGTGNISAMPWPDLRAGMETVLLAYAQQADQARTEFLDLWPGFAGESFRAPVEETLKRLVGPQTTGDSR